MANAHVADVTFTEDSLLAFMRNIKDNIKNNYHFVSTNDLLQKCKIPTETDEYQEATQTPEASLLSNSEELSEGLEEPPEELEEPPEEPEEPPEEPDYTTIEINFQNYRVLDKTTDPLAWSQGSQATVSNIYLVIPISDYDNLNIYQREIFEVFPDWHMTHPAQICVINNEFISDTEHLDNGRYTWISGGSQLKFYEELSNYTNESRKNGTIYVEENNGTQSHVVLVKGFDEFGRFIGGLGPAIEDSADTKKRFYRGDLKWSNALEGPLEIKNYLKLFAENNLNTATYLRYHVDDDNFGNYIWFSSSTTESVGATGQNIWGSKVFNAVFNDYAECRTTIDLEPGRVVIDNDNGSLSCASQRLQSGAQVISDTYGHLMGATKEAKTPIAVAGRVLVYPYQDRNNYHAGMAVCSAPGGTVDIMTREEIKEYPDCIVGIVSEIPDYEKWGTDQVNVNNRIWIKVK